MSSLTTLFNVGAEEYVEFNESLGSKAFLEHVWDQETTPLKQGETADSRLRSAGARLSSSDPPRIEFPTISRIKGKGNEYRLTGRWISWQDLQRRHPLAVRDPPDIAEFQRRGAKVGAGEKLNPGEWLTEESLSSKAAKHGGAGKKETRENDGWIARGSSQSKYAPKPVAAASSSPQVERNGVPAATPLLPQSNGFAAPSSSSSLLGRFTTPAEDEEEKVSGSGDDVHKPGPKSPKTPARTRPAGLQLDLESTPTHMKPFSLPLVSPSTTRTPLSATHPLPETPLKHTSALPVAQPNSARQALAERRSRPSVPPLSPPSREAEEEAMRGLGLGLGLTPTRPTAYVGLGAALSPVQRRMDLPTIPSSNDEGDEGGASSHETVKASSQPPVVAAHRDEAVDEIESMLLRLRKAKSGLASAAGSSASRWASPAATTAPLAAPLNQSIAPDSQDEMKARKVGGEERPQQKQQQKAVSAEPEVAVNGKAAPAGGEGRKDRKTKKEKKDKPAKSAAPSASSTAASTSAAAAAPPPPTPQLSSDDGGWDAPKKAAVQHPPTPTAPRAMRQKPEERRPDTRARAGKEAASSAPSSEPSVPVEQPPKLASPPAISSAPRQPTPPPLAEPSPPPRPATPPPPSTANDAAEQPPQTPAMPSSATSTSLASPLLASPSPSTPSHRDLDWAADDDDDEDALPDLGDWGVVLPPSGSTSSVGAGAADVATQEQPQTKPAPARAQPKAPAPPAQRELFPAGGPANAKGARGGQARAVSAAQAVQPSSSSSSSEYAAWRRGERASSAKPAALPASSSRELFPSSSSTPANNGPAASPAWPRHHQQHAAQAAPSPADGDWKAARTATLAAEEKREKKVAAAAGAKNKGKAPTQVAAQAAAKRAQSGATASTPAPPAAQGIKIAGVAKAGGAAPASSAPPKDGPPQMATSPPKGPKADRVVSKKGGAGNSKKKETAAAASANGGGDGSSKHKPRA